MKRPKIVVVGAGYAGMSFLTSLKAATFKRADVTLISPTRFHTQTTMLHKVATRESASHVRLPLRDILPNSLSILETRATRLDLAGQRVETPLGTVPYDYLICAAGFDVEDFHIPGVDRAFRLTSYESALQLEKAFQSALEQAQKTQTSLSLVICGGGLTGVEVAGSCQVALNRYARAIEPAGLSHRVMLINADARLLPGLSASIGAQAQAHLEALGVVVKNKTVVSAVSDDTVTLQGGESIPAHLTVWAAGVRGSDLIGKSIPESVKNRVMVNEHLQHPRWTNAFFIGDVSLVRDASGAPLPPTAQLALQEGAYLAATLEKVLLGQNHLPAFTFHHQGTICSVGPDYAVATVWGKDLAGRMPSILKRFVEKKWLFKLLGPKGLF